MSVAFCLTDRKTGEVWFEGIRCDRRHPCPVCKKPDWCLVDTYRGSAMCQRTLSSKPYGKMGYYHEGHSHVVERASTVTPHVKMNIDVESAFARLRKAATSSIIRQVAASLGVTIGSLLALDTGYSLMHDAVAWPMKDADNRIIGVRFRTSFGDKFALSGSSNGIFAPPTMSTGPVFIPEGPTNVCALLSVGFDAIGRPFCQGGINEVVSTMRRLGRDAVIIGDRDEAGIRGAEQLASSLFGVVPVKLIYPPSKFKDVRDWYRGGATKESIMYVVEQTGLWRNA